MGRKFLDMDQTFCRMFFVFVLGFGSNHSFAQVDENASEQTRILYNNLKKIQNSPSFLFGQEFFNSFRYNSGAAQTDKEYSDSKAVTGSHPALLGSDFHYYLEKSADERNAHLEAVKWAYQQGYAITFDWHISGRGTTTYSYQATTANLVNNILSDINGDRAWFYGELDKVINIINNELVVNGERIPVVFRPLHEMNGNWFWWGTSATTADKYKLFYRLLVDYMKVKTTSVLFCWSPNAPVNFSYYPGDDYVDVLGVDIYEANASNLQAQLASIVDYSQAHGKVAVLSETGNRTSIGDNASLYWKNTVLPAILNDPSGKSKKIAWVLTWINATWSYPYVPHAESSQAAKQGFIDFKDSPYVLFGDEIVSMYAAIPDAILSQPDLTVAVDGPPKLEQVYMEVHYNQSDNTLAIDLGAFRGGVHLEFYDMAGKLIAKTDTVISTGKAIMPIESALKSGVYILHVANHTIAASKKIMITRK